LGRGRAALVFGRVVVAADGAGVRDIEFRVVIDPDQKIEVEFAGLAQASRTILTSRA